jgi:hypothetical protein
MKGRKSNKPIATVLSKINSFYLIADQSVTDFTQALSSGEPTYRLFLMINALVLDSL